MEINLFLQTENITFNYQEVIKSVKNAFNLDYAEDKVFSLIIVDKEQIRLINKQYRNLDKPTDVISFVDREDDYIGDIFICADLVKEQAILYNNSEEWVFAFLLIHGILHLSGYDHKNDE
ncbi:MAG: rRNA maturation RNase YbeY, partial [Bacilli bacterium]|nr:rRNA maturation RNase YbeY [Bacilli bacterium]